MPRTLVVSDLHLASPVCRAKALRRLLKHEEFDRLVILGDLFDHGDFRRLSRSHWKLLGALRRLSSPKNGKQIIWLEGNHDRDVIHVVSHMIGATVIPQDKQYVLRSSGKRYLFIHGHQFDDFIVKRPVLTAVASALYGAVQRYDGKDKKVSRWLKYQSKSWLKVCKGNQMRAVHHGRKHQADVIICGHTHQGHQRDFGDLLYVNTGSWVDIPSTYAVIDENGLELLTDWSEG